MMKRVYRMCVLISSEEDEKKLREIVEKHGGKMWFHSNLISMDNEKLSGNLCEVVANTKEDLQHIQEEIEKA